MIPTIAQTNGHTLHSLTFVDLESKDKVAFHKKQLRVVLSNCGLIDPESIDDYLAVNGYEALEKVLATMTPEEVNEDRLQFAERLTEEGEKDLQKLGLHLDTLKIQNVSDDGKKTDITFTVGKTEVHHWFFRHGALAPQVAGVIH